MPTDHKVSQGEGLTRIALAYGFLPETLWDHPNNKDLKQKRVNPEILLPGDVVYIPDKERKEIRVAGNARHRFRRKGIEAKLEIQIMNGDVPRAEVPYLIEIDNERTVSGTTDAQGWIRASVPPRAQTGKLRLSSTGETYRLQFGHLDPIDSVSGLQARLSNLGFYNGSIDGKWNDQLIAAVKALQFQCGLTQSGKLDADTQAALEKAFGS